MKNIIALIPARGGSKGIKNKNLKKVGRLNLVERAIEVAKKTKIFQKIILSSDKKNILKYADKYKILKHDRPKQFAKDESNISQTILDIKKKYNFKNTYLFILEPTSPLRTSNQIKDSYKLIKKKRLDSFCTFTEAMVSPYRVWELKKKIRPLNKKKNIWVPRQAFKTYYQAVGNVIAFNLDKYKPKKGILFGKIGYIILDKINSIDIDSTDDLNIVRKIFK